MLDPVGVGASNFRRETAMKLLSEIKFTAIRGNLSEIKTLACESINTNGVDANTTDKVTEENLSGIIGFAKAFSKETGAIISITGEIDIVTDGEKAYCIKNGHPMMSFVTGTGCQLSSLTAAFIAANKEHPLEAAAAAVCTMGFAGETAYKRLTEKDGNVSYRNYIIDAVFNMTPSMLEEGAKYEVR